MNETRWTTLPSAVATEAPAWASDETRQLAAEVAELFDATRQARAEVERLKAEAQHIDVMVTTLDDLVGAGSAARRGVIEALRSELVARSKFAEFLAALEVDRRQTEAESLERIGQARADGKQQLIDAGCRDLSEAVNRHGEADRDLRNAWGLVLNSGFQAVGKAADTYREARSMATALTERIQSNRRHREEAESALRSMLSALASLAVA